MIYMGAKRRLKDTLAALKTRSGKVVILGALLGGPVGMTGYVIAINNIGAAYTAIISAFYPALGAFLSFVLLKEKMDKKQIAALVVALVGVMAMGYISAGDSEMGNATLGLVGAVLAVIGWGSEAVLCAWGMRDDAVDNETALQIRETTSALVYGIVVLPLFGAWGFTASAVPSLATGVDRALRPGWHRLLPLLLQGHLAHRRRQGHGAQHLLLRVGRRLWLRAAGHRSYARHGLLLRADPRGHCSGRLRLERALRPQSRVGRGYQSSRRCATSRQMLSTTIEPSGDFSPDGPYFHGRRRKRDEESPANETRAGRRPCPGHGRAGRWPWPRRGSRVAPWLRPSRPMRTGSSQAPASGGSQTVCLRSNRQAAAAASWMALTGRIRASEIASVRILPGVTAAASCYGMFEGCSSLKTANLTGLDTSSARTMGSMFKGCSSLVSVDFGGMDTSSVQSMSSMFNGCEALTSLDLSEFDTTNVNSMDQMFYYCESLESLDLSGFKTGLVETMNGMFGRCKSLSSLDITGLDLRDATDLEFMFIGCTSLKSIDLSGVRGSGTTNYKNMFFGSSVEQVSADANTSGQTFPSLRTTP